MYDLENIFLTLSLAGIVLSIAFSVLAFISWRKAAMEYKKAAPGAGGGRAFTTATTAVVMLSLLFITLTIVFRGIQTGHGPFSNMYEFALAFAWGVVAAGIVFRWRYKTNSILNIGLIVSLLLLVFAVVQFSRPGSLVPALQQSALLSAHVASAVVAYGTLTIGFGAAILYLIQERQKSPWLPDPEVLDSITYRTVIIGFPFLTLLIVLGAFWADIAWGRYWGWYPKETASLVTWLIYAAYLHARIVAGWRGTRASLLLIAGFLAILLTFFGNYIFSGLHTYA
jgi:cytochrome c-type biogenesis protein CcsB